MNWAAPAYAWLILLLVPMAVLYRRAAERRRRDLHLLTGDGGMPSTRFAFTRQRLAVLPAAAAFLLIVATLCRPQWGQIAVQQNSAGVDILVALDVSRSMLADDLSPTRLVAAKQAISELLPSMQGDRIGLIAFAGSAFLVCPLTNDYGTFSTVLAETGPDSIPLGGSILVSALAEAGRAFRASSEKGRYLIVISDGENHGGDVTAAVEGLRQNGVTIYSLLAGTSGGGLIPLAGGEFLKNHQGAIVRSRAQVASLQGIAAATGGHQLGLASDQQALARLYATELSAGQRHETLSTRQLPVERFQIPLALALVLLSVGPLLQTRRP